ncbi:hypothetical protein GGX14DRAFT_394860 [Mycena pura]|uniref:Uncharacterized protein n=1 Tax=Mycena pura TaxID=153505 RepID=A0AAD6VDX9_9AGAR|nr:hypothetical protein GGX14DRAFT_394860 [Mycena pura]
MAAGRGYLSIVIHAKWRGLLAVPQLRPAGLTLVLGAIWDIARGGEPIERSGRDMCIESAHAARGGAHIPCKVLSFSIDIVCPMGHGTPTVPSCQPDVGAGDWDIAHEVEWGRTGPIERSGGSEHGVGAGQAA